MQKEAGEGCQGDGNPPTPEREGRYYDSDVTNSFLVPFPVPKTGLLLILLRPRRVIEERNPPINRGRQASTRDASRARRGMKASSGMTGMMG